MNDSPTVAAATVDLQTAQLRLRPLSERDERLFCELYTDAATMAFIGPALSPERAARGFRAALSLTRARPAKYLYFSIVDRASEEPLGVCSLQKLDPVARSTEAGIMLNDRGRRRGLSKEALEALIAWAFQAQAINEIRMEFSIRHAAARQLVAGVCRKLGGIVAMEPASPDREVWRLRRTC